MSVVIHLGGEIPSSRLAREIARGADLVIAADSGYDSCLHNGIVPQVVTGDFDSIQSLPASSAIRIVPAREQNATDFEKALRMVPQSTRRIDILGGTGLRSDHFLTNLLIASGQPAERVVTFHDDLQTIHRVTPLCPYRETLPTGTVVSLIPFSDCSGTTTDGLCWNLHDENMGPGSQFGQSNRVDSPMVVASIRDGRLFVVVNHPQ